MASLRMWIVEKYSRHRASIHKLVFEIVIVFIGVTAAFALESVRRDREEADYRSSILAALAPTLDDVLRHNAAFENEAQAKLAAFDAAIARHERPALPIFREDNAERPPTRIWDSVIATGAARALKPDLLFQLARFYNRQESLGERYVRYAAYTETQIFPLGADPAVFYDEAGQLRPMFAAYVDRLRDLLAATRNLTAQAKALRADLDRRT
ncbi:MAG: hypothetical protein JSR65_00930 [Proteobacteria bacterium]|nr:hypothetical protein [Pseudomonadota bacterium]